MKLLEDAGFRERAVGHLALLFAITLFSTIEVAAKAIGGQVPPLLLASLRFTITGVILLAPAWHIVRYRQNALSVRDFVALLGMGLVGVTISIGLFHMAIPYMQANAAAIVFSAHPVFVVLFTPWILKEKPSLRKWLAVLFGLAGIAAFLVKNGRVAASSSTGVLLMVGAQIAFSLYIVLSARLMPRFGAIVITCVAGLTGGALLIPFSLMFEGNPVPILLNTPWLPVLYLAVVATAVAYIAYFYGLLNVGAARGAMTFFLKPVLASVFAWALLGEKLDRPGMIGAGFVLIGMALTFLPQRRKTAGLLRGLSIEH